MSSNPEKPGFSFIDLLLCAVGTIFLLFLVLLGDQPVGTFLSILRLLLTVLYLFFIPGYLLQVVLLTGQSGLISSGHLALSFVLSVALVAPVTLLLNWLPGGLRPWPITVVWFTLISILLVIAGVNRWKYGHAELRVSFLSSNILPGWRSESKTGRLLVGVAAFAIAAALVSGIALALTPHPNDHFTEFYVLNHSGTVSDFPSSGAVGQPITLFAGIRNQEGKDMDYFVNVRLDDDVLYRSGNIHVINRAALELPLIFVIQRNVKDHQVTLELFQVNSSIPYRTLRLFVDFEPSN